MAKGSSSTSVVVSPKQLQWADITEDCEVEETTSRLSLGSEQCAREQSAPRADDGGEGHISPRVKQKSTPSKAVGKQPHQPFQVASTPSKSARSERRRAKGVIDAPVDAHLKKPPEQLAEGCAEDVILEGSPTGEPFAEVRGIPIEVSGMPAEVCTKAHIQTILRLAGIENEVVGHQIRQESKGGVAVIKLKTWEGAQRCYRHFDTCSWNTGALQVRIGMQRGPLIRQHAALEDWSTEATSQVASLPSVGILPATPPSSNNFGTGPCIAVVCQPQTTGQPALAWQIGQMVPVPVGSNRMAYTVAPDSVQPIGCHNPELEEHFHHGQCLAHLQARRATGDSALAAKLGKVGYLNHGFLRPFSQNPMPYSADPVTHRKALARAQAYARG